MADIDPSNNTALCNVKLIKVDLTKLRKPEWTWRRMREGIHNPSQFKEKFAAIAHKGEERL